MELITVKIEKPEEINFILGQSHFIKTVEDIHEALISSVPGIKFGLAFNELQENAWCAGRGMTRRWSRWRRKTRRRSPRGTALSCSLVRGFIRSTS